jgi:hypothetical protein
MPQKDTFQDLPADKYPRSYSPQMKKKLQSAELRRAARVGDPFPANTDVTPQSAEKELVRDYQPVRTAQRLVRAIQDIKPDKDVARHRKEKLGHKQ